MVRVLRNVFEDCAHWWALARQCLIALDAIHALRFVHLDLKADNVCIPVGAGRLDPPGPGARCTPRFDDIALIDFAFSLVSATSRFRARCRSRAQPDYEYQSPRLLHALDAGRAAIWRRRASSTGAATSSASPRCSGATCPSSTTPPVPAGRALATPRRARSFAA